MPGERGAPAPRAGPDAGGGAGGDAGAGGRAAPAAGRPARRQGGAGRGRAAAAPIQAHPVPRPGGRQRGRAPQRAAPAAGRLPAAGERRSRARPHRRRPGAGRARSLCPLFPQLHGRLTAGRLEAAAVRGAWHGAGRCSTSHVRIAAVPQPYPNPSPCTRAQDPEASNEEADALLSRQFAALRDALGDEAPAVRTAAAEGLAQLLGAFWELIPAAVTAGFLKRITGASGGVGVRVGLGLPNPTLPQAHHRCCCGPSK